MIYDAIIIGGGVVGCAVARELSRYGGKFILLEGEADVSCGASGANSGVVHSGVKETPGTFKAEYCVEGNKLYPKLCRELAVPYKRIGTLIVAVEEDEIPGLKREMEQGQKNNVPDLRFLSRGEVEEAEPNVRAVAGVSAPSGGVVSPFGLTIALAENALSNGVEIRLNAKVTSIKRMGDLFVVDSSAGRFETKIVVNSAGVHSGEIASLVGIERPTYACRGEYYVLDKTASDIVNTMVYPIPPKDLSGFGVHFTPTVCGNLIVGPTTEYVKDFDDDKTTAEKIRELREGAQRLAPGIDMREAIREYASLRAKVVDRDSTSRGDFIIEDDRVNGFINLMGIESPGLTAAPHIAKVVVDMIKKQMPLKDNKKFNPIREGIKKFDALPTDEKRALVKENPNYGEIVCRCENVTKQEILDALNNPLGVRTLKGVKFRLRSMMGRCQGGYCMPRIVEIMQEVGAEPADTTLKGECSELFIGDTKCLR